MTPNAHQNPDDVIDAVIVGGGFAGCLMSIELERAGHKVMLIDVHAESPLSLFRAEKISGDQLQLLQQIGLLDDFKAASTPVSQFINIRGKHIIDRPNVEEYGLLYPAMINLLRKRISPHVFKEDRVIDIELSDDTQRVVLASGEVILARLVILATGQGEALCRKLGFKRVSTHPQQTICVGFSLTPPSSGFQFPAITAYGESRDDRIDYLALFPLEDKMRGNLFIFCDIQDSRLKALRQQGMPALLDLLPGLQPWIGDCEWSGETSIFPIELYRWENLIREGIILIGDALRTSCPAVGTGLSCALVDVLQARDHIATWLKTPGMGATKIASFYSDPIKRVHDDSAYRRACRRRFLRSGSWIAHLLLMLRYGKRFLYDRIF